jgi:acyl carrier protein
MNTLTQDVLEIVALASGINAGDLKLSDILATDLALDSMDLLNLAQELEQHFQIELPDSSVRASMTIGELITEIERLKAA